MQNPIVKQWLFGSPVHLLVFLERPERVRVLRNLARQNVSNETRASSLFAGAEGAEGLCHACSLVPLGALSC